ncbi:MAG: hypothetical protein AAGC64_02735 [Bacteroidota bacterium]
MEVDGLSGLLDKGLPFDRSFYLKIKVEKDVEYSGVFIAKDFKKYSDVRSIEQKVNQYNRRRKLLPPETIRSLNFKTEAIKGDEKYKYLIVLCPPLPPNVRYEFILSNKYSEVQMFELYKLFDLIKHKADTDFKNWIDENEKGFGLNPIYERIPKKNREAYKEVVKDYNKTIVDFREDRLKSNRYLEFYERISKKEILNCSSLSGNEKIKCVSSNKILLEANTKKIVEQYLRFITSVCVEKKAGEIKNGVICSSQYPYNLSTYIKYQESLYKTFLSKLNPVYLIFDNNLASLSDDKELDKIATLIYKYGIDQSPSKDFKGSLEVLSNLKTLEKDSVIEILKGRGTITGQVASKLKPEFDYISAERNNHINIIAFNRLAKDLKLLSLVYGGSSNDIKRLLKESIEIISALKTQKDVLEEGIAEIRDLEAHVMSKNIFGNTQFEKISSEASKWILPDAGLLYAFSKEADIVRPFLGVNINFGPVDKDVRSRLMPKSRLENVPGLNRTLRFLRQHTSIMLGVTLGSIAIEDTRDDLFGGVNIATGLGFRFNRAIRLSSGALLYSQINPNPVVSDKKTKALWYFSATFDIEFQKATQNNLSKVFK